MISAEVYVSNQVGVAEIKKDDYISQPIQECLPFTKIKGQYSPEDLLGAIKLCIIDQKLIKAAHLYIAAELYLYFDVLEVEGLNENIVFEKFRSAFEQLLSRLDDYEEFINIIMKISTDYVCRVANGLEYPKYSIGYLDGYIDLAESNLTLESKRIDRNAIEIDDVHDNKWKEFLELEVGCVKD